LAGEALALEVERRDAGTIGVRARGLQQRKVVFDLVVGGERARDAARQQEVRLAEFRNDFLFQGHGNRFRRYCASP
jgi:hypothetical protein